MGISFKLSCKTLRWANAAISFNDHLGGCNLYTCVFMCMNGGWHKLCSRKTRTNFEKAIRFKATTKRPPVSYFTFFFILLILFWLPPLTLHCANCIHSMFLSDARYIILPLITVSWPIWNNISALNGVSAKKFIQTSFFDLQRCPWKC